MVRYRIGVSEVYEKGTDQSANLPVTTTTTCSATEKQQQ